MDVGEKKQRAIAFIQSVSALPPGELNALITKEAGEELAQFFLAYASNVLAAAPEKAQENASSLMLMGYLIRAAEETAGRADA